MGAFVVALACLAAAVAASPAAAAEVEVDDGALTWGMKASWRAYAGPGVTSGDVSVNGDGEYVFPLAGGTYDSATGVTRLLFNGSVHWQHHYYPDYLGNPFITPPPGYGGPFDIYILDFRLTDPEVTISPDGSILTAEVVARTPDWQLTDLGRVALTNLDVSATAPTVAGGTTTWSDVPASVTAFAAKEIFGGQYPAGSSFDAVSVSYVGPGGAPNLSENLSEPGVADIERQAHTILWPGRSNSWFRWWTDDLHGIVHAEIRRDGGGGSELQAFDAATMQPLGQPVAMAGPLERATSHTIADPVDQRVYYASVNEGAVDSYVEWDGTQYVTGTLAQPLTVRGDPRLLWDAERRRGFSFDREVPVGVGPTDYDQHVWHLNLYTETADKVFSEQRIVLPNGPKGWNRNWYSVDPARSAVASDGSLILPPMGSLQPDGADPAIVTELPARRVVVDGGTAVVANVPGTSVGDVIVSAIAAGNGHAALIRSWEQQHPGAVLPLRIGDGGAVTVGAWVELGSDFNTRAFAMDPTDGTIWAQGVTDKRLVMIRNGKVIGTQFDTLLNVRVGFIWVDADHDVYALASDGQAFSFIKPYAYAFAKFSVLGYAPTVATQPQSKAVSLGVGEGTESVAFSSTGDAPRRWQVKAPGASRFTDLAGETAETLTVAAARGMDHTQYRALYENAAGRVASDVATLSVDYAPVVKTEVFDRTVTETADAQFSVQPDGNPEPVVTWQRRVAGFWQSIAPDDDNFAIEGSTLTVKDTNSDQSGSLFRARLANSLATVYSRAATLTVKPKATLPAGELHNVTLDWSGNAELQKAPPFGGSNFFSAGVSDGSQGTYAANAGNVSVFQVSAAGAESAASWLTRADHVLGGGRQLVRLYGGTGTTDAGGATTVHWSGAFSVNFYGGLVPFTLSDLELTLDESGTGSLVADLAGYGASMANPSEREPLAPVEDVTIATFSGVAVTPGGKVAIAPDYAGVEVSLPGGSVPQNRVTAGWGAWPQAFVDFQVLTGLSSYWYSSGGAADQYKQPHPLVVDFAGVAAPPGPPPAPSPTPQPDPPLAPQPGPQPRPKAGTVASFKRTQAVNAKRLARVGVLTCASSSPCTVRVPKHARVRIAGKRYRLTVLAPKTMKAGTRATVLVRVPREAVKRLTGGRAVVRLTVTLASQRQTTTRTVKATIDVRHARRESH